MKRLLFSAVFILLAASLKAQSGSITFFNLTGCTIRVALLADDNANYSGNHCTLASNLFNVPPFSPVTFTNTAAVNAGPGWTNPWVTGATTHHWDGIRWLLPTGQGCSIGSAITSCVINVTSCLASSPTCGTVTATYTAGVNDIVTFN